MDKKIRIIFANFLGGLPKWWPQCVRFDHSHGKLGTNIYILFIVRRRKANGEGGG